MSTVAPAMLWGTLKYEFRMQARRKALWISMAAVFCLSIPIGTTPWQALSDQPLARMIGNWALTVQFLLPVVYGVLMADRLPRDSRLNISELFRTLPASSATHLVGKYLGSSLATGLPIFLIYCAGIAYMLIDNGDLMTIPLALAVFATVIVPGLLFVAAFSIACPAIIWVPLYQFLFVGYWFWGNALNPAFGIPTLTGTLLTPMGGNAAVGFFGTFSSYMSGSSPTWLEGVISIGLLAAVASVALIAVHQYLKLVRARQ